MPDRAGAGAVSDAARSDATRSDVAGPSHRAGARLPSSVAGHGPVRALTTTILLVLGLLLAISGPAAAAPADGRPGTQAAGSAPAPADVDVDTLVSQALSQLGSSSVALLAGSRADRTGLENVVATARDRGVTLWIVSIGSQARPTEDQNTAIGDRILAARHGTVFVLSAEWVAVRSDNYSSDRRQAASDAASNAGNSDTSAAQAALDSLTAKSFPWGWVILAVVLAVIAVALAGAWWERRRRRRADAEELARLTKALSDRVGALAPSIVTLSDQVDLVGRKDLSDRFNQASADYNALRDTLAAPLPSRRAVKANDGRVATLEKAIADLTSAVGPLLGAGPAGGTSGPAGSDPAAEPEGSAAGGQGTVPQ